MNAVQNVKGAYLGSSFLLKLNVYVRLHFLNIYNQSSRLSGSQWEKPVVFYQSKTLKEVCKNVKQHDFSY